MSDDTLHCECWFPSCTQSMISDMARDRNQYGWTYKRLGAKYGFHSRTVSRFLRAYEKYGKDVFAADKPKGVPHGT